MCNRVADQCNRISALPLNLLSSTENAYDRKTTYVHCQPGRGRSNTIVLCYLVCEICRMCEGNEVLIIFLLKTYILHQFCFTSKFQEKNRRLDLSSFYVRVRVWHCMSETVPKVKLLQVQWVEGVVELLSVAMEEACEDNELT